MVARILMDSSASDPHIALSAERLQVLVTPEKAKPWRDSRAERVNGVRNDFRLGKVGCYPRFRNRALAEKSCEITPDTILATCYFL